MRRFDPGPRLQSFQRLDHPDSNVYGNSPQRGKVNPCHAIVVSVFLQVLCLGGVLKCQCDAFDGIAGQYR